MLLSSAGDSDVRRGATQCRKARRGEGRRAAGIIPRVEWQLAIVGALLVAAAGYLVRRAIVARKSGCAGGCGCEAGGRGAAARSDRLGWRIPLVELGVSTEARCTAGVSPAPRKPSRRGRRAAGFIPAVAIPREPKPAAHSLTNAVSEGVSNAPEAGEC
jgi:hypothetical protein